MVIKTSIFNHFIGRARIYLLDHAQLSLALGTVAAYALLKLIFLSLSGYSLFRLCTFALTLILALLLAKLTSKSLPQASRIVFLGITTLFSIYLLASIPSVLPEGIPTIANIELNLYHWVAPIFGVLSLWRVAFALPLLTAMLYQKKLISSLLGIPISVTDYMPVLEFGFMLTTGSIILYLGQKCFNLWQKKHNDNALHPLDIVMLTAIAAHFSNYFYSGVQKISISHSLWEWATQNDTYNLTLASLENGSSPITYLNDSAISSILDILVSYNTFLNSSILLLQLISIVVISKIRWAAITTLLYDVTHLVIFIVSGIFFYKWIILNLLITISLTRLSAFLLPKEIKAWLIGVVIFSPLIFFVAFLGWYDTPSFNDEYIEAVAFDGKSYRVPSNYFLSASITFGQQRIIRNKPGHFPTDAYGSLVATNLTPKNYKNVKRCLLDGEPSPRGGLHLKVNDISHLIRNHHKYILSHLNKDGVIDYDLYPHHIFSMPWNYTDFYDLDKRTIKNYRYVVESKCLSYSNGTRESTTILRSDFDIPIYDAKY